MAETIARGVKREYPQDIPGIPTNQRRSGLGGNACTIASNALKTEASTMNTYDFSALTIDGVDTPLSRYRGTSPVDRQCRE